jgi:hypothetical protein
MDGYISMIYCECDQMCRAAIKFYDSARKIMHLLSGLGTDMKCRLLWLLIVFFGALPTLVQAGDIDRFCVERGYMEELECDVPLTLLVDRGDEFNGRIVAVTGYFAAGPVPMLFASNENYLTSNVVNGVILRIQNDKKITRRLFDLNHRLVTIRGRYNAKPVDLGGYSPDRASGSIYDIQAIGDAYSPWGYVESTSPPAMDVKH